MSKQLDALAHDDDRVGRPGVGSPPLAPTRPSPAQQQRMRQAKRVVPEPSATELRIGEDEWSRPVLGLPHTDEEGWRAQAKQAFGTASGAFVEAEIHRLLNALRSRYSTLPLEVEVNAAIAVIEAMRPRNEIEAMLASQMALAHVATVEMLARLGKLQPHSAPEQTNAVGGIAAKLMRAFSGHVDTLARLRKPAVQVVRVERVNVEAGGQAIVGTITHPGVSPTIEDQAYGTEHARAGQPTSGASLWGQEAGRIALHEAESQRPEPVQASRRRTRQRRAQG